MQARFLLGPAGSGKTFQCLAEIREALRQDPEGPPLLLIAPKQATFQLERQLLADGSIAGYTRLQIASFERLAEFIVAEYGLAPLQMLDEQGRLMVLRALLTRLNKELKIFHATARLPGFAQQLSVLLRELQRHKLDEGKLTELAKREGLSTALRDKLHDFALLQRAYFDWLKSEQLQDASQLLDVATDVLKEIIPSPRPSPHRMGRGSEPSSAKTFRVSGLWLDGFAEMTPQEIGLLLAVVPCCEQATLAFCLEELPTEETAWLSPWTVVGRTFRNCHQRLIAAGHEPKIDILPRTPGKGRFAGSPAIAFLEENWSQPPTPSSKTATDSLRVIECTDIEAEAVFAAREILRHVRDGGRFRDCAVIVRSLDYCHNELRRVFQRYEIPFFLDRREPLAHHPLAELTRFALRTVAFDWRREDWFGALKTGLISHDDDAIDELEEEALALGWEGKVWREPLQKPDDLAVAERFEQFRKQIIAPFEKLATTLGTIRFQPTGSQLAAAIRDLWDNARVDETLERWSGVASGMSAIHGTVREQMNEWLENLELAFSEQSLLLRDWLPILEAGLGNLTVGVIPPALDQVLVGAIDRSRSPDLKLALLLGMNEGIFPAPPRDTNLLTESDRDTLEGQKISLGTSKLEQIGHERYYGYIACTRASERLVLTYAQRDAQDKALNPSPFISQLQRLFPGLTIEKDGAVSVEAPTKSNWTAIEHVNELAPMLVQIQARPGDLSKLIQIPAVAALAHSLRSLRNPSPTESLSPALAERLYGPVFRTSVSAIERFAACPFQFFVHSGLRAAERQLFEVDARERGSFQHEVLRRFHEEVRNKIGEWRDLKPTEARDLIGAIASIVAEEYRHGLFRASPESMFAARGLTSALQDFVETIIEWMPDYGFNPRHVELSFGSAKSLLPAWEIDLGEGHRMAFRGQIDRVDVAPSDSGESLFVVMDYKSSGKKIDPLLLEHGAQIQLPAYLAALREVTKAVPELFGAGKLVPMGAFYVNLRGDYPSGTSRSDVLNDGEERRKAYRHTGRFSLAALPILDRRVTKFESREFNYSLRKDGKPNRVQKDILEQTEFVALLENVEKRLREMGRKIFAGEASVDPYQKGGEKACDKCACASVCRIDPWTHRFRVLRKETEE